MPDDYTSNTSTTGTVAVGGSVTGNIETGDDRDWFAVTLEAGRTYRIDLEPTPTGSSALSDPLLYGVYDADGNYISGTRNDDGDGTGRSSQLFFTATEDAIYYVAAASYQTERGTYTVSVTDVTNIDDDFEAGTGTSGEVDVDGSVRGEIESQGDRDWFAVDLTRGTTYQIDLKGTHTGDGSLLDPYLAGVYNSGGDRIYDMGQAITDDDGGEGANSRVEFTPTANGTYYVSAGGYGSNTGAYTLSVTEEEVPDDDHSATTGTTGAVDVDGSVTGEIETGNDRDWFAVVLEADTTYRIDLKGSRTGDGTLTDPFLRGVYNAAGNLIADTTNDDGGRGFNSRFKFTPTADGTYYVAAGGNYTGTYTLSVMDLTDDYSATRGTIGAVDVGGLVRGEIDYRGDRDWFRVSLEEGATYEIYLEGSPTGNGTLRDPYLRGVYDRNGNRIAGTTDDDGGVDLNSEVEFTAQYSGDHYVAAGGHLGSKGTYTLSVLKVADSVSVPDDFTAATGTTGAVAVGGSATGEIDYGGDRDWFAVTLVAGKTYQIDLKGSRTGEGTLEDPFLRGIHDENGVRIAGTGNNNGGTGRNSRVEFTADDAGTYYVAAGASGDQEGTYTLSVTELAGVGDDFAASTQTTGVVEVGGSTTGEIERSLDRDWFAVELVANTTYQIDLEGAGAFAGTLRDPYLRGIHGSNGNLISGTRNDDFGMSWNSRVDFTPTADGTYYVAAGAYGGLTGTYTLSVVDSADILRPGDDYTEGTGTTGAVAVGGSATGEIETLGDQDWFAVTLVADKTYQIDLKGSPTGNALGDPYLYGIHDVNGVLIVGTTDDDGGEGFDSRVEFTPVDAGTYYVAAGGLDGDEVGTYTLSVAEIPDDFSATTRTTGAVAVGGSATGEIDYPNDRDWFAVELDADRTYRIELKGNYTGDGSLGDPYLAGVHDADGGLITGTTNDDVNNTNTNSRVSFTPVDAGTYYVAAGGLAEDELGTYTLTVAEVIDDYLATTQTTGAVAVGGSVTGEIEIVGDRDWFAVTLVAGKTYQIDLKGNDTGDVTLDDPYLYGIHNADGDLISGTEDDDGGEGINSRVTFTSVDAGTYYVAAGSTDMTEGAYTLTVIEVI